MFSPGCWLKSFHISRSSPRDKDRVIASGPSSCSRGDPASSSPLQSDSFVCFFCMGVPGTGTGWFSGSAAVPVAGVWVAAVPVAGTGVAAVPVVTIGMAAVPAAGL